MAVSDSASSSSSAFKYDVFMSFRGSDTRAGFTGYLFQALNDRGIRTFVHDAELEIGDEIKPSLVQEIEKSRIAVVVFSKNYASSTWCLDELVFILNRFQENRLLVLPVFYDVDPSDVRNQKGNYGEALAMHSMNFKSNSERIHKWINALHQAANLSGWRFKHGDGYEYKLIQKIVDKISSKIHSPPLTDADHPVGLNYRKLEIEWHLNNRSCDGLNILGIHGVAGIGKTTLAREVYNSIALNFDAACFLDDVGERTRKHGILHLQETLLANTVGAKDLQPATVTEGSRLIVQRLRYKKVFLVLDDVDNPDQWQATVGGPDWFGSGSRIIITTRDIHVLESCRVEKKYELEGLTEDEALELLCWKAFKSDKVRPDFIDKLFRAVTCASGIPLALEVIGSNLYGKGLEEWESTLDSYEQIPHKDIQMILKQSYDALAEKEKEVFLDIACFFEGYEFTEVEYVLSAHHDYCLKPHIRALEYVLSAHHDYCLKPHIRALVQKSLIKINERGCVTLHDLIRDMGKEIVRQESPKHPGKRTRLWSTEDVVQILQENTGGLA